VINLPRLRRPGTVVVVGLLLAGALAGYEAIGSRAVSEDGPVKLPFPHGWVMAAPVGHAFTDGFDVLQVRGSESIHVTDVRIEGDAGLELAGALLVPHILSHGIQQYYPNFPPKKQPDTVPLVGATVAPTGSPGFELILGIRANQVGRFHRSAVVIDYSVGSQRYRARLPAELDVCGYQPPGPAPECSL
jgi:hypothetical protein